MEGLKVVGYACWYEFTHLCHTTSLYTAGVFCAGDAFKIFYETPELVDKRMESWQQWIRRCRCRTRGFGKDAKEAAEMFASTVGLADPCGGVAVVAVVAVHHFVVDPVG
eukprot:Skav209022  [mRNA]  locus=scaffold2191:72778:78209:- [translate_table: standard]